MKVNREMVKIKIEAKEINLHIYFEFGGDGRITGIKSSQQTDVMNSFISNLESLCPECHCLLNLNFFVHDGLIERQHAAGHSEDIFSSSEPPTTAIKEEVYEIHEVQLVDPMSFTSFDSKAHNWPEAMDVPKRQSPISDDSRGIEIDEPSFQDGTGAQSPPAPVSKPKTTQEELEAIPFRCTVCKQPLKTVRSLRKHMKNIHKVRPEDIPTPRLYCRYCFQKFTLRRELAVHVADHSKTCIFCNHTATNLHGLQQHLVKHHNDRSPHVTICSSCGKPVNRTFLTLHLKACHKFRAPGERKMGLRVRAMPKTGNPLAEDSDPGDDGNDADWAGGEARATSRPKSILCIYCQNVFYSKQELVEHQSNHSLECLLCEEPKMYTSLASMKKHVRKFHCHLRPKTDDLKTCPNCSKDYNKGSFSTHLIRCLKKDNKSPTN